VEVDESYIGGVSPGNRGRGTDKAIQAIAVERLGYGKKSKRVRLGGVRMRVIPDTKRRPGAHQYARRPSRRLTREAMGARHAPGRPCAAASDAYLGEFTFRFNRRATHNRGLDFYRLLQQCLRMPPLSGRDIVISRGGQRGKRRGPAPKPRPRQQTATS
jgi:hypothetical protein